MKNKVDNKKCYSCRKPIKGKKLFCKECEDKPEARKTMASTFIGGWH